MTTSNPADYLAANEAVDSDHPAIIALAKELSYGLDRDEEIVGAEDEGSADVAQENPPEENS